jgi:hypothetical protein
MSISEKSGNPISITVLSASLQAYSHLLRPYRK